MSNPHVDNDEFEEAVIRCIPSEFILIAGQADTDEAQESYGATKLFNLPNAMGKEGGVATSSLLSLLYDNVDRVVVSHKTTKKHHHKPLSVRKILKEMHSSAKKADVDATPQISSSRPLGPPRLEHHRPFYIVPPDRAAGKRRALCIGVNFAKSEKPLRAPHNDCHNVQQFLLNECGFKAEDMIVLRDDEKHKSPTKKNMEDGFQKMVELSQPGDVVFISYSGHGGLKKDTSGDEEDGYDSMIFPVDFETAGAIIDDDILKDLIKAMPKGVYTTMLVDCCHSGTIGDLPYVLRGGHHKHQQIETLFDTDTRQEILEKERQAGEAAKERKRAKAERKRQRELRMKQVEEETKEYERQVAAGEILPMGSAVPPPVMMMPPSGGGMMTSAPAAAATTTQTFTVGSQEELDALCTKFGTVITISKEQKEIMKQGGKVTTTFTTTSSTPTMMMMSSGAPMMMMMPQTGGGGAPIMMSPEQAAAFAKQHGGQVIMQQQSGPIMMMSPEQAAAFAQQQN